ncbi:MULTISPECIES: tyrosine-protein phosphatase [Sphingobium]|uniref:tyrosine-protein phosphatase n=1 Tax=Sphingobium TaxID=165695 RepID=UPI00159C1FC3|nr:tyrosine-protein phosphatase [Sphingobium sp. 15-1]
MTADDLQHERTVMLEGGSNVRELGGYRTESGRLVRWGTLYRSGSLWKLTAADWQWIAERRIATVCDLRTHEEREISPTFWQGGDHTRHVGDPYPADHRLFNPVEYQPPEGLEQTGANDRGAGPEGKEGGVYGLLADLLAPSFRMYFDAIAEGHVPVIVHCTAGQDRTGLVVGILLTILGVPRETILHDYSLSTMLRSTENEIDHDAIERLKDSNFVAGFYTDLVAQRGSEVLKPRPLLNSRGELLLLDAFRAIERRRGSIGNYVRDVLGIDDQAVARLREVCLEDEPA